MAVSKKLRFEVFKRDSFTCQYCGSAAPDVILHVDHIEPTSKGGSGNILNLITSCEACNLGKGARRLSDDTVVAKRRNQLKLLQERREQLDMMLAWQKSLTDIDRSSCVKLAEFWTGLLDGQYTVTDDGIRILTRLQVRFPVPEILEAMRIACNQYLQLDELASYTEESVGRAFQGIGGICATRRKGQTNPHLANVNYCRKILRNELDYINEREVLPLLFDAFESGADFEAVKRAAREARSWTHFRTLMAELEVR